MQLKKILSKFNRNKKLGIKVIPIKRKDEVVNYLLHYKHNLSNPPEIEKQPTRTTNVLKDLILELTTMKNKNNL